MAFPPFLLYVYVHITGTGVCVCGGVGRELRDHILKPRDSKLEVNQSYEVSKNTITTNSETSSSKDSTPYNLPISATPT